MRVPILQASKIHVTPNTRELVPGIRSASVHRCAFAEGHSNQIVALGHHGVTSVKSLVDLDTSSAIDHVQNFPDRVPLRDMRELLVILVATAAGILIPLGTAIVKEDPSIPDKDNGAREMQVQASYSSLFVEVDGYVIRPRSSTTHECDLRGVQTEYASHHGVRRVQHLLVQDGGETSIEASAGSSYDGNGGHFE